MRLMAPAMPKSSSSGRIAFLSTPHFRDYVIATLLVTAVSDALFFDTMGGAAGMSAPLFGAALALAAAICHRRLLDRRLVLTALWLVFALLTLIENVDGKSLALAIACLACFSLAAAKRLPSGLDMLAAVWRFLAAMPIALPNDIRQCFSVRQRMNRNDTRYFPEARTWPIWVMPIVLTVGFVLLLGAGNPILERVAISHRSDVSA